MSRISSVISNWSASVDRIDLFRDSGNGRHDVVRIQCIDRYTFRIMARDSHGGFDERGAAQILDHLLGPTDRASNPKPDARSPSEVATSISDEVLSISHADAADSGPGIEVDLATGDLRLIGETGDHLTSITLDLDAGTATGTLASEEALFGTGSRFDGVDRRGTAVDIWAVDRWCETDGNSYVPIPFFYSCDGYGVFQNRFEPCSIDLGAADDTRWRIDSPAAPLDLYLFLHTNPKQILGAFADLTGHAPLPPTWSFGVHVCRHLRLQEFSNPEGIREMMQQMDDHDLPYSSVIIEGWDTYDRDTYPKLAEITGALHELGKKVLVYEPCGRFPNFWIDTRETRNQAQWDQAEASESWMVHDDVGAVSIEEAMAYNPADAPKERKSRFLDLTNPEATRWWLEEVWHRLVGDIGIDGAKIDFCEQIPEGTGVYHDGSSPSGMHHQYPVIYNTMMYRYYHDRRPEGGMCFSRGGGIGAQRYPFLWCGDQLREWRFLRAILSALLTAGLSGIPFMSHDLAGYMPSRDPDHNDETEVFVRGTQLGCFTGNMQTHGIVTRPYDFDETTVAIYRLYSKIHYALVPYIAASAAESSRSGVPLLRPLSLEFPKDIKSRGIEDEYLLGPGLLVAPILSRSDERSIYLPDGSWEPLFGGDPVSGPEIRQERSIGWDEIPVFVRRTRNGLSDGDRNATALLDEAIEAIRALFVAHRNEVED